MVFEEEIGSPFCATSDKYGIGGRMRLLTVDNHPAEFTAIADSSAVRCNDFFKISSPYLMDFKTFRAAVASKLIFGNGKMTMPAAQLVALARYQREDFVFTGAHSVMRVYIQFLVATPS